MLQNPFGILFHPRAIEKFIYQVVSEKVFTDNDIFFKNERWHCFDVHSTMSSSNKETLLYNLNSGIKSTYLALKNASHCIITFGTAWIYRFSETDEIKTCNSPYACSKMTMELLAKTYYTNYMPLTRGYFQKIKH